jgi:branched-subunit amino acid aminotransferase/4-amino-4-deoxychorismate lyase
MNESVNRAFMYGESVFTTMRMVNGEVRDWELHFERLRKGADYIYGPFKEGEGWQSLLRDRLENRLETEQGDKILRLTLYREQQKERGLLTNRLLSLMDIKIHVDTHPLEPERWEGKNFHLRTVSAPTKPSWWPSYLKAGSYLETILAQKKFLKPGDDDLLFLSHDDTVFEASVANIFVCRHDRLYTAPAGPNVLEGVMRKRVLELAPGIFPEVCERETTMKELFKADGIFGTNSIRGLFLISKIDDHEISTSPDFLEKFVKLKQVLAHETP